MKRSNSTLLFSIVLLMISSVAIFGLWYFQQTAVNKLKNDTEKLQKDEKKSLSIKDKLTLTKDFLSIEKDTVNIQNGIYTSVVQAIGGVILVLTAYVGYCNLKVAEDKQVADFFGKAIEQLGSEKIDVRLGGIYALEQIMNNSNEYRQIVIEILSAYVRRNCFHKPAQEIIQEENQSVNTRQKKAPSTDIQAALTILSRSKSSRDDEKEKIDLSGISLIDIELKNFNFSNTNFYRSNLTETDFTKAVLNRTFFRHAELKDAIFMQAELTNADFSEADLTNANFEGANLRGADMSTSKKLTSDQIKLAFTDNETKLPWKTMKAPVRD
jgi:hypothetical protein